MLNLLFKSISECEFTYTESWVKDKVAFPISPHIPFDVKADSQTIVNFIRNLFPEGESFDTLLYNLNVRKNNLYAVLKEIGKDTPGALTFGKLIIKNDSLREITEEELAQLVVISGKTGGRVRLGEIARIDTIFEHPEDKVPRMIKSGLIVSITISDCK